MEQSFLAWLKGRTRSLPNVTLGIGDDGAIVDWPSPDQLVMTVDTIVDQVDFLIESHSLKEIGHKAIGVNLSDLAAMAADPVAALVALSLPNDEATQIAAGVYEGILETASKYGVAICGGDITCYDGPLSISITMIGRASPGQPWRRSGASVSDAVLVSGHLGGSILGKHLNFTPRVQLAQKLRESFQIRAAMDISDGLLLDLDRLCAASGCGIELSLADIPISDDARQLADQRQSDPLDHALGDGEDFELILVCDPQDTASILEGDWGVQLTQIGTMTSRTGLWSKLPNKLERLLPRGYVHGEQ